jgi:hypothetical protein
MIDWMPLIFTASELSILGRDEQALQSIERIKDSPRLPWNAFLRDAPTFSKYGTERRYLETLQVIEDRKAALRQRLTATLAEFGVALDPAQSPLK